MRPALFTLVMLIALALTGEAALAAAKPQQTMLNKGNIQKLTYPRIVAYTVSWCPHCRELKEYLTKNNIPFINRDVEIDPSAMDDLTRKYQSTGVPVIVIGNEQEILKGFAPADFEMAVQRVKAATK